VALLYLSLANETTRAQRNADKSGLLRLPPEIRQRIWTYAVHVQTVIVGYGTYPEDARYYPEQSILRVCRQVHAETCLLPYSGNTFSPDDMGCFNVWLKRRLPEQLAALRRLELWCHEYPKSPLRLLSGLKHVRVYCICDGLCPLDPGRGKAIKENLEGIWGNSDLEIQIAHG